MKKLLLSVILIYEVFMIGNVYSQNITDEISDKLLRMHILANSNSEYDQNIKIMVRDFVIEQIKEKEFKKKSDIIKSVEYLKDEVNSFLNEQDAEYECEIIVSDSTFMTKEYYDLSIPAGDYQALKIILGEGKGENWWCVAYPPLCFTESVTGKISDDGNILLNNILNDETYNIIKNNNIEYRIKFKTIELINSFLIERIK